MTMPGGFQPPPTPGASSTSDNDATIALVSGILALVCCGFAAIPAIIYGNRVRKDPTNPQQGLGTAGFIMGWISVVLWVLGILGYIAIFAIAGTASTL